MLIDEFIVLMEHAGIIEFNTEYGIECLDRVKLVDWIQREAIDLFDEDFMSEKSSLNSSLCSGGGSVSSGGTILSEVKDEQEKIDQMIERLVEKGWLVPVDSHKLFSIRLSTTEAYRIYIERDTESATNRKHLPRKEAQSSSFISERKSTTDQTPENTSPLRFSSSSNSTTTTTVPFPSPRPRRASQTSSTVISSTQKMRVREKMWSECFPTCSEGSKRIYFSFKNPVIILYATLGLNLISNGISSVPAFSRELKDLNISAEDRIMIVSFLAKAFPCE
jgi:hypothetical protein